MLIIKLDLFKKNKNLHQRIIVKYFIVLNQKEKFFELSKAFL